MSDYRLQIVHVKTEQVVKAWQPGTQVETDLVDDLCRRVKDKGLDVKAQAIIKASWLELLMALKRRV